MKILVTGGSGFIGGTISRKLSENEKFKVFATGRKARPKNLNDTIEYFQMDLNNSFSDLEFDICIHCAGLADDKSTNKDLILQNVIATENLIRRLKGCDLFIFVSSASVYDFKKNPLAKEENASLNNALSTYGRSKLLAEKVVQESSFTSSYILRPRAVYGDFDQTLFPKIAKGFKNGKFTVPGNLRVKSSLTNVNNLAEVVQLIVNNSKKGVHVYNVCDRINYELREVFTEIGQLKSKNIQFVELPIRLVRSIVFLCQLLKIPISFSQQSIDYISQPSTLDNSRVLKELNVDLAHNFSDFIQSKK